MPAYSSSLRLVQPVSGEYPGTWGTQVNDGITALVDTAIAGTASITVAGSDITLTTANGAADQARSMIINLTGSPAATRNIICPSVSKLYVVSNNISTGHYVTFKTSAGTGVVIPNGETRIVRCDGTNVVNALTDDIVSITDFGVALNSTADQTTNIQAAIDAVSAAGGGDLYVPAQTGGAAFYVTNATALSVKQGVRLVGDSRSGSILRLFNTTTAQTMINVNGASDVTFFNLTLDVNNSTYLASGVTGAIAITLLTTSAAANNLCIQNCDFVNGKARPYIDYIASTTYASRGWAVLNCNFIGSSTLVPATAPNVQTTGAIRALAGTGCGDFQIIGNTSKYCGRFIQIRHSATQAVDQFDSVVVSNNISTDFLDDPNVSTSPYELFCITGLTVTGNTIYTGGRGFNASFVKGASYTGNVAYDQTKYFFEMQSCDGITISGNTAYNCKTFVNDTTTVVGGGSSNIHIVGNSIVGGNIGEPGYDANTFTNVIGMLTTRTYSNWRISDNTFNGQQYAASSIRIDGTTTNVEILNNQFIQTEETQKPRTILIQSGSNIRVVGNVISRSANITDATEPTASRYAFIELTMGTGGSDIRVEDNLIRWTGTDSRTGGNNSGVIGIGSNGTAAALAKVFVRRNTLLGTFANAMRLQMTSGDSVIEDNDVSGATGANSFNAAIVYLRTKREYEGTAAPTAGTYIVGDRVWNSAPAVGQPKSWVCTVAGTPGTWVSEGNL